MEFAIGLQNIGPSSQNQCKHIATQVKKLNFQIFVIPEHCFQDGNMDDISNEFKPYEIFSSNCIAVAIDTSKINVLTIEKVKNIIYLEIEFQSNIIKLIAMYARPRQYTDWESIFDLMKKHYDGKTFIIIGDGNAHFEYFEGNIIEKGEDVGRTAEKIIKRYMEQYKLLQFNELQNERDQQLDVCLANLQYSQICSLTERIIPKRKHHHLPYKFR